MSGDGAAVVGTTNRLGVGTDAVVHGVGGDVSNVELSGGGCASVFSVGEVGTVAVPGGEA